MRLLHDGWGEDFSDDEPGRLRTGDMTSSSSIAVTPGGIVLRRRLRPEGREAVPDDDQADELERDRQLNMADQLLDFCRGLCVLNGHSIDPLARRPNRDERRAPRACRWWSERSRARMIRCLASVDWSPVFFLKGTRPAMLTLTYPGDWLTAAPDADTAKAHLRAFHERLRRLYQRLELPDPPAIWKLEFQRRGAPHFHIYAPVPTSPFLEHPCNCGALELEHCTCPRIRFRDWLSKAWAEVVDHPDPDERLRHQLAGTGLDFAEGARCSDPKRLAVYFTRHNTKGSRSKAHQHHVPDQWATAGRWWGTWGVERILEDAPITDDELVQVKRLLRSWVRSQRATDPRGVKVPRTVPRRVRRGVDPDTGEISYRWVRRRYRLRSLSGGAGGFVISNDGPALAAMLARFLERDRAERNP